MRAGEIHARGDNSHTDQPHCAAMVEAFIEQACVKPRLTQLVLYEILRGVLDLDSSVPVIVDDECMALLSAA